MELCGALLLAKLIDKVKKTLFDNHLKINCWSDSKVVLAWLQGDINRWERYIANRVSEINNIISPNQWSYVKSEENPADCATRGLYPTQLQKFKLWWEGPAWLKTYSIKDCQDNNLTYLTNNGQSTKCCVAIYKTCEIVNIILHKYSSYKRVIRVLGWIIRIINIHIRKKSTNFNYNLADCDNNKNRIMSLTVSEITEAEDIIIKNVQREYFGEEIEHLEKNRIIPSKSNILKLTPFLDAKGLLRVKGRLINAYLPPETKHPIILPSTGRLTEIIIQEAHRSTLHGGARLTLAYIRLKYWIIGGNRTVKKELRQCVRCHRFKTHRNEQIMGDLPKERVTPTRPFTNTGVDFTGHVDVKINKGRGVKTCKAYIAIFICMVTKAVHLELVSDLTTQAFLAAFKRMCARRGTPKQMYSDNGTNFVGAAKLLQEDFDRTHTLRSSEFYDEMSNMKIQWHFNAPFWPTAGGLWEAAVKSMKYHLKRVLGEQKLTYEQFYTLLTQIEACLNSRPLCPLTEDVEDLEYLTPGHFLIGGSLLSPPQEEENLNQIDLRNKWRLIEQMNLHIWKRWSNEYIHQLQVRSKWKQTRENLEKGNLVLVKDEHVPPGRWAIGRVIELHKGADDRVRVVTIKTKKGLLKRPITKLSPLPQQTNLRNKDEDDEENNNINNKDEMQTENLKKQRKRGCTKIKKANLLSLFLMTIITMGIANSAPTINNYEVTFIQNNHPMYFDEAGKLQLIHDEWTLLIYYNLTSYWKASSKINIYIDQIDRLCQRISHEYKPCETVVDQLRHELHNLLEYNTMILSSHSRQKRGYFDGVGKLSRTLFGVLDADFAQKYERDIQNLQNNDNYLLQLIKNQTLILEAENNLVKRNTDFIDKQFQAINAYLNQTCSTITKIENRAHILYTINDINSAAVTSSLILTELHRIQELLMNALADIFKGHLDTHLFPASQLIEQLNIISGRLPQGLSLPIKDIQRDFQTIFQLIHVKARITNNYLLFELHIPLLSDDNYIIYRIIPIPFLKEGRLKIVQLFSNFIAINLIKNFYITLKEEDMQHCTSYGDDEFTCISSQPV